MPAAYDESGAVTAPAFEVAISTIRQEHRCLDAVMTALQQWLARVPRGHAAPDFEFFSAVLYYIDDFPERQHHPKENDYLFKAIRCRTHVFDMVLDRLQAEHVLSASMIAAMDRALVHYQGGAPDGLAQFNSSVDAYAVMLREHMRKEEELLAAASAYLQNEDWLEIAAAFAQNDDPLFGPNRRADFGKLYARIINSLPGKLRPMFQHPARADACGNSSSMATADLDQAGVRDKD